jgi:trimethylguanosine synthase
MSHTACPFGDHLQAYWNMRYRLFSKFDKGIQIDEEGLYSVKPEVSALAIGKMISGDVVLDSFCGVGGSAIGLARAGKKVIAVDAHSDRLSMAANNARIYGVHNQIEFIHDDALHAIRAYRYDSIYLDPPWGGPEYYKQERFPLAGFVPGGDELLCEAFAHTQNVAVTVPLNFDMWELTKFKRNYCTVYDWIEKKAIYFTIFFNPDPKILMRE